MDIEKTKSVLTVALLLSGFYAFLVANLYLIQVIRAPEHKAVQENLQTRLQFKQGSTLFERPARGAIYDRNGHALALGYCTWKVLFDMKPEHRPRKGQKALTRAQRIDVFSGLLHDLNIPHSKLEMLEKIQNGTYTRIINGEEKILPKRGIVLARNIHPDACAHIARIMRSLRIGNFGFVLESQREYPYGADVAEIVGFVGQTKDSPEISGRAGIEGKLDDLLRSSPGRFVCDKDGAGRELEIRSAWIEEPRVGWDVHLTLDVDLQKIAGDALKKARTKARCEGGVAIVLDSQSGAVLAMKSEPEISLEDVRSGRSQTLRSRAVTDSLEPGSTIKPLILAKAIEKHAATWEERFDTNHGRRVFRSARRTRTLKDSHPHGILSAEEIIIQSSNIGMAMIGWEKLGYDRLLDAVGELKLGRQLNIFLPGVARHHIPKRSIRAPIYPGVSLPFGHQIAMTPLAMTAAFNIFATGGVYHPPHIVAEVRRGDEVLPRELKSERLLPEDIANHMLHVLGRTTEEGTARVLKKLDWHVGAKTGTAQILGSPVRAFNSSMIAIAPLDDPKLTVYVCLFDVRITKATGGQTAGPAVAEILEGCLKHLGVPRDKALEVKR